MEFYSFSFGELKVGQADDSSPKVVGLDLNLAFKTTSDPVTVQTLKIHVSVPHQAEESIEDAERRAYERAQELLSVAARHCADKSAEDLLQASKAQVIKTNRAS